jgi:N utilization substance protein A
MSREIIEAVKTIEREKGIEEDTLIHALEDALLAAYKKTPGASRHATVELDPESGDFRVFSIELPRDIEERLIEEARERAITELEEQEIETGEHSHVLVSDDDLQIDWSDVDPALVKRADVTPENFGRIAAQTAKQVILQRIREAEREMMYDEYIDRVGEVVTGIVQQAGDRNNVLVDLGKVEALLPRSEQVDGERYEQGSRIKAVITEVRSGTKGPQVILSRRDSELIRTLFELEVPEIADGLVDIKGVAREPGYRSKIAVESHAQGVDPVGACVGPRGSRVRMVVSELRGEKIDISVEPARFVARRRPVSARFTSTVDKGRRSWFPTTSASIGKEGLNARLAARLTSWKVDIHPPSSPRPRRRPPSPVPTATTSQGAASRSSRAASAARTGAARVALLRHSHQGSRAAGRRDLGSLIVQPGVAEAERATSSPTRAEVEQGVGDGGGDRREIGSRARGGAPVARAEAAARASPFAPAPLSGGPSVSCCASLRRAAC